MATLTIPKDTGTQGITFYVVGPKGDQYEAMTDKIEFEFNSNSLIIDVYDKKKLETDINESPTIIYDYSILKARVAALLEALEREEEIYVAQKYLNLSQMQGTTKPSTETAKKNHILAAVHTDPVHQQLWAYIGTAKSDFETLRYLTRALKSHQFKVKQLYDTLFGKNSREGSAYGRDREGSGKDGS